MSLHLPGTSRLLFALACAAALGGCGGGQEGAETGEDTRAGGAQNADRNGATAADADTLTVAGFQTPESVLWDAAADAYIVSNINGDPLGKDDNGFISRVSPDGKIESLRWIDGASEAVTLHAPKGLAIRGDTLFVADIDTIRAFDRSTGRALGARGVAGASFLNDLATDSEGNLYASDSGFGPGFQPTGTDAVYRIVGASAVAVAKGTDLTNPNGLAFDGDSLVVVPFGGNTPYRLHREEAAARRDLVALPAGQLDGVVRREDGSLLVSSWEGRAIFRIPDEGGPVTAVIENVTSPADIGWDSRRNRVLIPVFQENVLLIRKVM
jgi:sugar lactone lactonase YvrE